jgi:hypothetical protein
MSPKNWAWEFFHTDNQKYLQNKYHKNAWCLACIQSQVSQLRDADAQAILAGQLQCGQKEDQLFEAGE